MMTPGSGFMMIFAAIYFVVVIGIVVLVITAMWRMARAQEAIVEMLADIRDGLRSPPAS